jgi:hypothetical protein
VTETAVCFGPEASLVGVLTEPDHPAGSNVTVVMSNVGLNHRVGPSRIWVDLARRLAKQGVRSFRFDASGLGDSAPRADLLSDIERSVLDLKDALDWLAQRSGDRFVLVSLCSGTDNAHRVAVDDSRVIGAVFLDGYNYPTPGVLLDKYLTRWASRPHWRRFLRRRLPKLFDLDLQKRAAGEADEIFIREYPSRQQFVADLSKLIARDARMLFVFSGETAYSYRRQFWDWVEHPHWADRIEVEYYPKANHTYTYLAEREVMLERTTRFILSVDERIKGTP